MNTTPGYLEFEVKRYDKPMPFVEKLIYVLSAIGILTALIFNNFSWWAA